MKQPRYIYKSELSLKTYEFIIEGSKGCITKIVQFTETETENVYNLAFGDFDETTDSINDLSITNNGDTAKVLATVASIVYAFAKRNPDSWIFATGSTLGRTRLYRRGITNNLNEIKEDFDIFGLTKEGTWAAFAVGNNYDAFLLTKKIE